jgi:hypothetical protein
MATAVERPPGHKPTILFPSVLYAMTGKLTFGQSSKLHGRLLRTGMKLHLGHCNLPFCVNNTFHIQNISFAGGGEGKGRVGGGGFSVHKILVN